MLQLKKEFQDEGIPMAQDEEFECCGEVFRYYINELERYEGTCDHGYIFEVKCRDGFMPLLTISYNNVRDHHDVHMRNYGCYYQCENYLTVNIILKKTGFICKYVSPFQNTFTEYFHENKVMYHYATIEGYNFGVATSKVPKEIKYCGGGTWDKWCYNRREEFEYSTGTGESFTKLYIHWMIVRKQFTPPMPRAIAIMIFEFIWEEMFSLWLLD